MADHFNEINRLAGINEGVVPEPDYSGLEDSASDIIEAARLLGKAAEHGDAESVKSYYLALVKRVGLAGAKIPATQRLGHTITRSAETLREALETPIPWRKR